MKLKTDIIDVNFYEIGNLASMMLFFVRKMVLLILKLKVDIYSVEFKIT